MLFVSLKYANRFSFTSRIVTFFAVDLLVMVATPILCAPFMQSYLGDNTLLWTLSGLVCLTGIGTGVLFGGVVGMASLFPGPYRWACGCVGVWCVSPPPPLLFPPQPCARVGGTMQHVSCCPLFLSNTPLPCFRVVSLSHSPASLGLVSISTFHLPNSHF